MTEREYYVKRYEIELRRAKAQLETCELRVKEAQSEVKKALADVAQIELGIEWEAAVAPLR